MASASSSKPEYDLLLIGKTGHGKSSTGNSILRRKEFKASASPASVTFKIKAGVSEREDSIIKVIDGPGIGETRLIGAEAVQKAIDDMAEAMMQCSKGFHALLLVYKFGVRLTDEEKSVIDFLKQMLGDDFLKKFAIIVMSGGDDFKDSMEEEGTEDVTLMQWLGQQENNSFMKLIEECGHRIVLFNNKARNEEEKTQQVEELLQCVKGLQNGGKRYTNMLFVAADKQRQNLIIKAKLPQLEEEIQRDISLLSEQLENIELGHPKVNEQLKKLRKKAMDLIFTIKEKDQGSKVLVPLQERVESIVQMTESLEASVLQSEREKLEEGKRALKEEQERLRKENEALRESAAEKLKEERIKLEIAKERSQSKNDFHSLLAAMMMKSDNDRAEMYRQRDHERMMAHMRAQSEQSSSCSIS